MLDKTSQNPAENKNHIITAAQLQMRGATCNDPGPSGCVTCNRKFLNVCVCPGKSGGEESDNSSKNTDKKNPDHNKWKQFSDKSPEKDTARKEFKNSAPYARINNTPELTLFSENTGLSDKEKEDLKKIFSDMKLTFEEFKKTLDLDEETAKNYTAVIATDGKSITFTIPDEKHHNDFVRLLLSKYPSLNLVPQPQLDTRQKQSEQDTSSSYRSAFTPLKTTPSPYNR